MKKKAIFFVALFLVSVILLGSSTSGVISDTTSSGAAASATVLFLGVDSAAANSDVVVLGRYEGASKQLTLMQLPRDMYVEWEDDTPKLNHIYAACRAGGMSDQASLAYTANVLEQSLSIPIDMAVCMDLTVFASLVDAVGGVPMEIPFDMSYHDPAQGLSIALKKGSTVLDGKTAEQFVRYRSGYVEGDLGRMDAQKLFFAASLRHVLKNLTAGEALSVFLRHRNRLAFLDEQHMLLSTVGELFACRQSLSVRFLSIPGEAVKDAHTWYYVIHRDAACRVLNQYFEPLETLDPTSFDKDGRFYNDRENISNIYFSASMEYRIYSAEELSDINILKKD